ncbi:MAG: AAA family ATPase [Marinoscillum sp.]
MMQNDGLIQNSNEQVEILSPGSIWLRWEPHIHAPGTILNDEFADTGLDKYLTKIETSLPVIKALGITDYYSLNTYKSVINAKKAGRLAHCDFLFPNIEMRLGIGTIKGKWVNIHMLICPDDPEHIEQTQRFLNRLTFTAYGDTFNCSENDLIRLGKAADPSIIANNAAMAHGVTQFKVSLDELKKIYKDSTWAMSNILFAVAGNRGDGSSGVRDAADTTLRQKIDEFAHIIFSSDPAQREFWLGRKSLTPEQIQGKYGALKPCMHGSDAHDLEKIGQPDLDRFCWIKGVPSFDTLLQACIDPSGRAFIGDTPPISTLPSQCITQIDIVNTRWAKTPRIKLNSGLITIIGARGSGKTALAEIIAAGCDALPDYKNDRSFLTRAQSELSGATVNVFWGDVQSEPEVKRLDIFRPESTSYPRARYLSQQFVEELCSSDGVDDKLLKEIERVIFESHDINQKEGTINFDELLELKASRFRVKRNREQEQMKDLADSISIELDKKKLVDSIRQQLKEKELLISQYTSDRQKLVQKGSEKEIERLGALIGAADKVRGYVRYFSTKIKTLNAVSDEVKSIKTVEAPRNLKTMQERHVGAGIKQENWDAFLMKFSGDVDSVLSSELATANQNMTGWRGVKPEVIDDKKELIRTDQELDKLPLALLEAEIERLQNLISVDKQISERHKAVSMKISMETSALNTLKEKLEDYEKAQERLDSLRSDRDKAYKRVFDTLQSEEQILNELYKPIMSKLELASGTLNKMSFSVKRIANLDEWAKAGENLLDLRTGPFKGVGTLCEKAEPLKRAWETGSSEDVLKAMNEFLDANSADLLKSSLVSKDDKVGYKQWVKNFAKWLYGTDHIEIIYAVNYDNVDITKLSPGTRGIVLLLLYLALDDADDRPLIIDQPEENLDPKSIYDELVSLFTEAKKRRQVIMVTHNANLVVNTDADQIIVASIGDRSSSGMPYIYYKSGGLEEEHIRKEVCGILEGGEIAFKERARRLRVNIER